MNRRDLLKSAPALALAGAVPAAAKGIHSMDPLHSMEAETPIMALFREWRDYHEWLNSDATRGMPEAEFDSLLDRKIEMENRIFDEPAQSAGDLAAKVAAFTCFGECALPEFMAAPAFWAEARALIAA